MRRSGTSFDRTVGDLGDTTTVCPPEYMQRMLALEAEARGPVYGKDA